MPVPVARTDITPGTFGSWVDVDVSSYVDAGNTAGVILHVVNSNYNQRYFGVRRNGSSDTFYGDSPGDADSHQWVAVGVDSDDIFEAKIEGFYSTAYVELYIVGYITNDEGAFFTNAVDKTPASTGWNDIDISSDTGSDTAIFALNLVYGNLDVASLCAFRQNGSTDAQAEHVNADELGGGFVPVDGSEIFEFYPGSYFGTVYTDLYLVGYITNNVGNFTNKKDYSTSTTGSWVDVDFSSDIPAGNDGAFCKLHRASGYPADIAVRKNGDTWSNYGDAESDGQYCWTEIDSDRYAEQKIGSTDMDLLLIAYTSQPSAVPDDTIYIEKSTGKLTLDSNYTALKYDPTNGKIGTTESFTKYLTLDKTSGKFIAKS